MDDVYAASRETPAALPPQLGGSGVLDNVVSAHRDNRVGGRAGFTSLVGLVVLVSPGYRLRRESGDVNLSWLRTDGQRRVPT